MCSVRFGLFLVLAEDGACLVFFLRGLLPLGLDVAFRLFLSVWVLSGKFCLAVCGNVSTSRLWGKVSVGGVFALWFWVFSLGGAAIWVGRISSSDISAVFVVESSD